MEVQMEGVSRKLEGSSLRESLVAYYVTDRVVVAAGLLVGIYAVETMRVVMETGPLTMSVDVVAVSVTEASARYYALISGVIFPGQLEKRDV